MSSVNVSQSHRRLEEESDIWASALETILFQCRRTTTFDLVPPTTYLDIEMDTEDYTTDAISLDATNMDRINVNTPGTYFLTYHGSVRMTLGSTWTFVHSRIRIDDTTVMTGSESEQAGWNISFTTPSSMEGAVAHSVYFTCASPCYLTLQIQDDLGSTTTTLLEAQICIVRMEGGDGDAGSSGTLLWRGPWDTGFPYLADDVVQLNGSAYVANSGNLATAPPAASWDILAEEGDKGATWQGVWTSTDYVVGDTVNYNGTAYRCITDTTSAQLPTDTNFWATLIQKGDSAGSTVANVKVFDAYHTGGIDISSGFTDITLENERAHDSIYSHVANSSDITVNEDGTYIIFGHMSTEVFVGSARSTSQMKLQIDTGGGFADIPGTFAYMYNRITTAGRDSCDAVAAVTISSGDVLKMVASRIAGTDTVLSIDTCSLSIFKVDSYVTNTNSKAVFFDDFVGDAIDNIWSASTTGGASSVDVNDGIGGIVEIISGTSISDNAVLQTTTDTVQLSSNPAFGTYVKISHTSNTDTRFGFQTDSANSVEFRYDASLSNWEAVTIAASTETATDTGIAADTSNHSFRIVASLSSALFYIDKVLVATNNTNLPAGVMHPFFRQESTSGSASRTLTVDYIKLTVDRA